MNRHQSAFPDIDSDSWKIIESVTPYTMTSPERIYALINAVCYLERASIPGAIVECGVWRGGSMMAVAAALQRWGKPTRQLVLCDTFSGMTEPGPEDVRARDGAVALTKWRRMLRADGTSDWCRANLEGVCNNLRTTGYPESRIEYVVGDVQDTLPDRAPDEIALLRLDTDWYSSTRHELTHLYPRLSPGGALIVDDYGHWRGARRAVDQYFESLGETVMLHRVDRTGRCAIKPFNANV